MIIINGASRGIGKFLLNKYIDLGENVVGTFNQTKPESNIKNYFQVDVSDDNSIRKFVSEINDQLKTITLFNCAGTNYNSFAHKADLKQWENVININLIGTFRFISNILPFMRTKLRENN